MKVPSPLPHPLSRFPFTRQEAADAGITERRLRHPGLHRPSRGIRVPLVDDPSNLASVLRAYTRVTGLAAASHASAFKVWEFPGFLPGSDEPVLHVSRPDRVAIMRRTGVRGHRAQFFEDEIVCLEGLLITSRVRTWLDCARKMSIDEITVVADHLLRVPRVDLEGRVEPFATKADLEEMLDRHKGTPGIQKARVALEQARLGADSAPETRLRLALAYAGLPEPEVNVGTMLRTGVIRQPDLSYPEQQVAVEYDGEVHSGPGQVVRDIAREEDFARAGWLLVRISKRHMENDARAAVRKIRSALLSRGWQPN